MSDKNTIAQALRRVKKLKGQVAEHTSRATMGVSYDSTKVPAFRFEAEMVALAGAKEEMVELESRIAVANALNKVKDDSEEITLAKAIRRLQEIKGDIAHLKSLSLRAETVRNKEQEWSDEHLKHITHVTEVTFVSDLTEQLRDAKVKALQNRFEVLNNAVEDANHTVLV